MDKQLSLSALNDELAQVRTRKKEFLSQIERIVPWGERIALIRPYYYKGERSTLFDEEQRQAAGSGCPLGEKGQRVAFWLQGTYRCGQGQQSCSHD